MVNRGLLEPILFGTGLEVHGPTPRRIPRLRIRVKSVLEIPLRVETQ